MSVGARAAAVVLVLLAEMRRKPPEGLSPLLDLLRICSVETIEAVALWREAMVRHYIYITFI